MAKVLGTLIVLLLIVIFGYPFAEAGYQRYLVYEHLKSVMSDSERAEFANWNGDAASFARRLYDRCELDMGRGAVPCERYRLAVNLR